jgi:hypothetical protein
MAVVEIAGVLAADLDQPTLTPLKRDMQLPHLPVEGDQHLPTSHEHHHPAFAVRGTAV